MLLRSTLSNIICLFHILGYQVILLDAKYVYNSVENYKIQNGKIKQFLINDTKTGAWTDRDMIASNTGFSDNNLEREHFHGNKPSVDKIQQDANPQVVYFVINGALNETNKAHLDNMFHWMENPNGCPVSVSYFVPQQFTDFDVVKYFYDYNHDIGIESSYENSGLEAMEMAIRTDIPLESIKGLRIESTEFIDEKSIILISNKGYRYIVSENCHIERDGLRQPCIMDISKNEFIGNESHRYFNKLFELIPFNGIFLKDEIFCSSIDTCVSKHHNESKLYDFLWNEFEHTFDGKREPFGLYLPSSLFLSEVFYKVIERFIRVALDKRNVYIVSIQRLIDWLHIQTDFDKLKDFKSWSCKPTFDMEVKQKTDELLRNLNLGNKISEVHAKMNDSKLSADKVMNLQNNGKQASEPCIAKDRLNYCYKQDACKLPSCFYPTYKHYMNISEIPQIIYFGFDDHLNANHKPFYDKLFHSSRRNPNSCPLSATFYVSHVNTDYDVVKYYYDKGNEIGIHSVNHTVLKTRDTILYQASRQMNNIITLAGIPRGDLQGWRSPYLETAGDIQVQVLQQLGLKYDISYVNRIFDVNLNPENTISSAPSLWPFTLDSGGLPFRCIFEKCPSKAYKGFWIVPLNVFVDLKMKNICPMADNCVYMPKNSEEVYEYVWSNFKVNYNGHRAPFGLHLHPSWFLKDKFSLNGLDKFIREALKLKDVYIVSVRKMLDWVQNPTSIDKIDKFQPWKCT